MRLIVIQAGAMVADVVCGEQAVYVGARADCRIRLTDPRIADRQLVIYPESDGWAVAQLAPQCKVLINVTHLEDKATLNDGDEIKICDYGIRVHPDYLPPATARIAVGTSRAQLERFAASRLPPGTFIKKADESLSILAEQISQVGQANLGVSQCTLIEELMDVTLQNLLETFAAQRAWMGVRRVNYGSMEYQEGRLLTGQPTDLPEIAGALQPRVLDRGQFLLVPVVSAKDRTSIMSGPLLGPDGALGMIYIDTGGRGRRFNQQKLDFFVLLCGVYAAQLDAIFKQFASVRSAMVEGQVALAHEIQRRLTPRKLPQLDQLHFGAFREPGRENTGDIYDIVKLGNGMVAFMVAHTPATGPLPSMLMAQTQAAFRTAAMHQDAPHGFLRTLNALLHDGEKDHPLNCFAGVIEPWTGKLRYAIAGHTGAFIINNRGEERRLGGRETAPQLGLARTVAYPLLPETLEPHETLVAFTPGVTTAKDRNNETFGEERFVNILCDGFGQLTSTMLKEMLSDLRTFTEGGTQPDDITVLLAHYIGSKTDE